LQLAQQNTWEGKRMAVLGTQGSLLGYGFKS